MLLSYEIWNVKAYPHTIIGPNYCSNKRNDVPVIFIRFLKIWKKRELSVHGTNSNSILWLVVHYDIFYSFTIFNFKHNYLLKHYVPKIFRKYLYIRVCT